MFSHQALVQGRMKQQTILRLRISILTCQTLLKLPDLWNCRVPEKPSYMMKLLRVWALNNTRCVNNIISDEMLCIPIVLYEKLKHNCNRVWNVIVYLTSSNCSHYLFPSLKKRNRTSWETNFADTVVKKSWKMKTINQFLLSSWIFTLIPSTLNVLLPLQEPVNCLHL